MRVWHRYLTAICDRLVYRAGGWSDVLIIDTEEHNIQIDTNTVTDRTALEFLPAVFEELGKTETWSLNGERVQSPRPIPQTKESSSPEEVAARTEKLVRAREKAIPAFVGTGTSTVSAHRDESKASGEQAERKPRKGGPVPLSDEEKIKIVGEWYAVQGKENQEVFCNRNGIGTSTLRGYMRDLKAKGKLPPS